MGLTTTSYLILGLLAYLGPSTPYDLKRTVSSTIGYFWSFPHSQLYAEPARLARAGLLKEEREPRGRRRRTFTISAQGRHELERWLKEPTTEPTEVRDLGLLRLFFGGLASPGDVVALARQQEHIHRKRLAEYRAISSSVIKVDRAAAHSMATLKMGLLFEEAAVAFWLAISSQPPGSGAPGKPAGRRASTGRRHTTS